MMTIRLVFDVEGVEPGQEIGAADAARAAREILRKGHSVKKLNNEQISVLIWDCNVDIDHFSEHPPECAEESNAWSEVMNLRDLLVLEIITRRVMRRQVKV